MDSEGTIERVATDLKDKDGNPVTTIYVTVDSGDLPLTRPLRLLPGGDILADALDPTLKELVDAGYADGKGLEDDPAIPANPAVTRPMQPGLIARGLGWCAGFRAGRAGGRLDTAQDDLSNPGNFVTKPLDEFGKLPFISTLPTSLTNSTLAKNNVNTDRRQAAAARPEQANWHHLVDRSSNGR